MQGVGLEGWGYWCGGIVTHRWGCHEMIPVIILKYTKFTLLTELSSYANAGIWRGNLGCATPPQCPWLMHTSHT